MNLYDFIIKESCAQMPGSCKYGSGEYIKIGLMQMEQGVKPSMISDRAKGCIKVLAVWDRVHDGTTERCESYRIRQQANSLQAEYERVQFMRVLAEREGKEVFNDARLDKDLLACRSSNSSIIIRYDAAWKKTGVSIPMPKDLAARYGKYEHGKTRRECRIEIAHKRQIEADRAKQEEAAAIKAKHEKKNARRLHLISLLCKNMIVSFEDARAAGMCKQGIILYCARHGFSAVSGATLEQIKAAKDDRPMPAVKIAAKKLIENVEKQYSCYY
jgi:hypothetical protein